MARQKEKKFKQVKNTEELTGIAAWHLGQKDYTVKEMQDKLIRNTENQEWIDAVLRRFLELGYLKRDDAFAVYFAERSFSSQLGSGFILRKLTARGIPEKVAKEAVEKVSEQLGVNHRVMAEERLQERYESFANTTKEKLFAQMQKYGFSRSDVDYALSVHPAKDTLRTKLQVKAEKLDIEKEVLKLVRKGKGRNMIRQELKSKLVDVSNFDDVVYKLEMAGEIDFYESCREQLSKKRYDLTDYNDKTKAYAFLAGRGFTSDEIKEALS